MVRSSLNLYRKKRDFEQTAEPSGEAPVAPSKRRRFVIQKHDATRLHYDLRLEFDGVFKSWAVTRGPSLDPHDKRLAVEVEDHPLDYGDFEGTIPKGQYGGGTVLLWDRGYWECDDPEAGFKKGDLKFTLDGDKLHGSFVLVRMKHDRDGGKRTNWLLIKHRDEYAREGDADGILDEDRSVASGRAMAADRAGQGPRAKAVHAAQIGARQGRRGVGFQQGQRRRSAQRRRIDSAQIRAAEGNAGQIHGAQAEARGVDAGAKPNSGKTVPMPDFIPPQLCTLTERPPSGEGWVHEIKFDGYRVQLRVKDGKATLYTRKGLDWTQKFQAIAQQAASLPDAIIDSEIVALDAQGAPDFAALQAALSDGNTDDLICFAFDLLYADGEDWRRRPLWERKARLKELLAQAQGRRQQGLIRYVEHFETGGDAVLQSACKMSLEGIVSKKLEAPYRSGRSESWTKAKCRAGHEVVIGGWKSNQGKFRSLLVGVYRDDHLAYVGVVGTGFGRDMVKRIMPALEKAASDKNPFGGRNAPRKTSEVHWLKPELVAEIEFAGFTGAGHGAAGGVQGAAAGQAGRGGGGRNAGANRGGGAARQGSGQEVRTPRRQAQQRQRHGDGRGDLKARQGAVAGRRRRRAGDQARSGALLRGGRRLDAAAYQGPAVFDRARARRHFGRAVLSAPRDGGQFQSAQAWSASPATASPICRSTASRGWPRWRRSAASSCTPGIAPRMRRSSRGGWCSISIPRRTSVLMR